MGRMKRVEPLASRATIWRSNQLNYTHQIKKMARLKRFELLAHCLEGSCSIQLSYRRTLERVMGIEPTRPAWKAGILPLNYTRKYPLRSTDLYIIADRLSFVNTFFNFFITFFQLMFNTHILPVTF